MKRTGIRSVSKKRLASGMLSKVSSRSRPMTPGGTITSKKPIKQSNPARQAKRRKSYAQKLAAYHRSETYKLVEERACGQCEGFVTVGLHTKDGKPLGINVQVRCYRRRADDHVLEHHHVRYHHYRFGGKESPSDMLVLCETCHARVESLKPVHRARRSAT